MNQLWYETTVISSFIPPCQQTVFLPDYTVTAIINEGIVYLLKSCSTASWNVWTSLPADHLTVLRKHRIKQKHINLKQKNCGRNFSQWTSELKQLFLIKQAVRFLSCCKMRGEGIFSTLLISLWQTVARTLTNLHLRLGTLMIPTKI